MPKQVKKLAEEVSALSHDELQAFRTWFYEFDAAQWDKQLEADVSVGKLDALAAEALADYAAGRTKRL